MVPRRIGDVSCGENHTVWQTQRRLEESSSHPCSLQQWSHQRPLTCFHLALQRLRHSYCTKPWQIHKQIRLQITHFKCLRKRKIVTFLRPKFYIWWPNAYWWSWTSSQCGSVSVKQSGDSVVVTRLCDSALTLLLCSQPLPEAANGFAH